MHLLLGLVKLLRRNLAYGKRMREKEVEAVKLERELTLKKGLNLLYKNKLNGDYLEQKLQDYITSKNRISISESFNSLQQYYLKK